MCPHVSSYYYVSAYYYICVLMCPHTTIHTKVKRSELRRVLSYCSICVLMLLYVSSYFYMCPHTTIHTKVKGTELRPYVFLARSLACSLSGEENGTEACSRRACACNDTKRCSFR